MQKGLKNPGGELFDDDPLENVNDTPSPSQVREYARCQGTKEAFSDSNEVMFMVKTCLLTRDRIYCADGCREMSLEHKWESGSKDIGLECTLSVFSCRKFSDASANRPRVSAYHERLNNQGIQANFMRMSNQSMVGLATVICLLCQGYLFTYVLRVEPNPLVSIAPIFLFVLYIYARNRKVWWSHKPQYWVLAVIVLTMADLAPYVWTSNIIH